MRSTHRVLSRRIRPDTDAHIGSQCRNGGVQRRSHAIATAVATPRFAIIGSGPAGFYAARRLLQKHDTIKVDMFEKLPVPFGLVRYGVAPDHPEVKNCQDTFDEVASSDRYQFIGNVQIGTDIPLSLLRQNYTGVLFAYGASHDRLLNVPGESLQGVYSARAFVGWYNGLPEFQTLSPSLDTDVAVVIGNGNVALDVARILLSPVKELKRTDISEQALTSLSASRVNKVVVAGRRGPMQAAFTIKELRELLDLPSVGFEFANPDLIPNSDFINSLNRIEKRKYRFSQLLARGSETALSAATKSWDLLSMVSPTAFVSDPTNPPSLGAIEFERNEYVDADSNFSKDARTKATGDTTSIVTGLAFRSIGYKSEALPGMRELSVGFDDRRGMIFNDGLGRCLPSAGAGTDSATEGMYCAGWVKNGPTGVIASTMEDAFASADAILADLERPRRPAAAVGGWEELRRDPQVKLDRPVSWRDWKRIDERERLVGRATGKQREKITSVPQMLDLVYPPAAAAARTS